jgi:hypothetical protein
VFFEFDGATLNPVPNPASAAAEPTYNARLLLLPSGQVLYANCTNTIEMYTPSGGPQPGWRPHITEVPRHLHPGETFRLHGRQINGLSQAVAYGDDAQMATNYPLVRLFGAPSVGIVFCRTFDHSTMAVATGSAVHHTHFEVPRHLPHGDYELVVIANGIASDPVGVHVGAKEDAHAGHDRDHDEHRERKHEPDRERERERERERDDDGGSLTLNLKLPLGYARR